HLARAFLNQRNTGGTPVLQRGRSSEPKVSRSKRIGSEARILRSLHDTGCAAQSFADDSSHLFDRRDKLPAVLFPPRPPGQAQLSPSLGAHIHPFSDSRGQV